MRRPLVFLCLCVLLAHSANADPAKCPFDVAKVRELQPGEVAIKISGLDQNTAIGVGNYLIAHVRIEKRHAVLTVENSQTGEDSLFVCPYANLPVWSSDGKYLSVDLWTPEARMGKLVVFDATNWKKVVDVNLASAASAKWSPDSKRVAVGGVSYQGDKTILYAVSVPDGAVSVIDSTTIMGDFDFSWSPNSQWIAYSRPTKLIPMGDTMESDLCIADAATGQSWCLIKATDHVESNPFWMDDQSIQIDRIRWKAGQSEADWTHREERVVVVLKKTP